MNNILNRLSHFFEKILFSLVMPPLFIPRVARLRITRNLIAFWFGRLYGNKYQNVIDSFLKVSQEFAVRAEWSFLWIVRPVGLLAWRKRWLKEASCFKKCLANGWKWDSTLSLKTNSKLKYQTGRIKWPGKKTETLKKAIR